ncbi:MFS transporter [Curtobacterium flaccumfaciens]|nr:MFS transporter [Curtobacterium flaccumfaciens]
MSVPTAAARRAFRATLVGTVVTSIGQGLTLPFLFVYLNEILGVPLVTAGFIVAGAAVLVLGASGLGGSLADRLGLGRVAVLGLTLQAGGTLLLALAREPVLGVVGLVVMSAGNSLVWPSLNGLVTHQVPSEKRSRAFALRFGLMNVGAGIGSLIAAVSVSVANPASFHTVYLLDGATAAVFAAILLVALRGTTGWGAHRAAQLPATPSSYGAVFRDKAFVGYLAVLLTMAVFGSAQLEGPWASFVTTTSNTGHVIGLAFAANTLVIIALQLPVERLTRPLRRSNLLVLCSLSWAAAWALTGLAASTLVPQAVTATLLVMALGMFGLGETFLSPVINAMPNALAPEHLRGRYNAMNSATYPVSRFIGPPLAGILLGGGHPYLWVVFIVAGAVIAAGAGSVLGRRLPPHAELPLPPEPEPGRSADTWRAISRGPSPRRHCGRPSPVPILTTRQPHSLHLGSSPRLQVGVRPFYR